jgi:hypothetical protein
MLGLRVQKPSCAILRGHSLANKNISMTQLTFGLFLVFGTATVRLSIHVTMIAKESTSEIHMD